MPDDSAITQRRREASWPLAVRLDCLDGLHELAMQLLAQRTSVRVPAPDTTTPDRT